MQTNLLPGLQIWNFSDDTVLFENTAATGEKTDLPCAEVIAMFTTGLH